jgi:hypothetical protein
VLAPGSGGSTIRGLAINGFNSNDGFGLYLQTGSDNNLIAGNVIGLDADGTTPVSVMNNFGIYVASSGNLIGGTTAAARNVLSNNINAGIGLWGSNNVVIGNYIGTDATGTLDRGNAPTAWTSSAAATTVSAGSRRPSATSSPATTATASRSPTTCPAPWSRATTSAPTRAAPLAGQQPRRHLGRRRRHRRDHRRHRRGRRQPHRNNPVGGLYTDTSSVSFTLLGNTFDSNSNLAIDLRGDGVTANDAGDADSGANNLQNFPVLTSATTDGSGQLRVKGSLNSTASSYYRIEFLPTWPRMAAATARADLAGLRQCGYRRLG